MIVGIDLGGSTTDIIGIKDGKIIDYFTVKASDPIACAYGALGKFINSNNLTPSCIRELAITGAGSSYITSNLMDIKTTKVDEFIAIGLGGNYLTGLEESIVVSMGTGTAIVKASQGNVIHLGGTGVGGGTLMGLSKCILNANDFHTIVEMAEKGSLDNVDLTIKDISQKAIGDLPSNITVSNFGKSNDKATHGDYALAILNMIYEVVGMMAVFSSKIENHKDVVLTGKLAKIPVADGVFEKLSNLFKINFHLPELAEYSTAIGAAISLSNKDNKLK